MIYEIPGFGGTHRPRAAICNVSAAGPAKVKPSSFVCCSAAIANGGIMFMLTAPPTAHAAQAGAGDDSVYRRELSHRPAADTLDLPPATARAAGRACGCRSTIPIRSAAAGALRPTRSISAISSSSICMPIPLRTCTSTGQASGARSRGAGPSRFCRFLVCENGRRAGARWAAPLVRGGVQPARRRRLPRRLWDRQTGQIDPEVAKTWERYDIRLILLRNWSRAESLKLAGKLHIITGELDTFYLDGAVRKLKETLQELGSDAVVEIQPGKGHSDILTSELGRRIRQEMTARYRQFHPAG